MHNKRTGKQPSKPPKAEKRKEPKTLNKAPEPNQKEGPHGREGERTPNPAWREAKAQNQDC